MAHPPFGYKIEQGKVEVNLREKEQLKLLFDYYLSGLSLKEAAIKADINRQHGGITLLLTDKRYLGTEEYQPLISKEVFAQVEKEREKRATKLGRLNRKRNMELTFQKQKFTVPEISRKYDNPFRQAEYAYSLVQSEVIHDDNT